MIGWAIQVSFTLFRRRRSAFRSSTALLHEILLHSDSIKFALFLSNLVLVYRSTSCAMRRWSGRVDDARQRMISGFVSGLSMAMYPSTQIALHTFWKSVFTAYLQRFAGSRVAQLAMDTLFVASDSFLINCMVMEPHFVARSYLRLVDSFTGSYLTRFNIITNYLLGGRDNGFRYGTRIPDLNADHVSKKYMETIGSWSLELQDA